MTKRISQAVAGGVIFLLAGESFAARTPESITAYYTEFLDGACQQAFHAQNEMELKTIEGHYTIRLEEHSNNLRKDINEWHAGKRTIEQKQARVEGLVAKLAAETAKAGDAWRNTPEEQSLEGAAIGMTSKIMQLSRIEDKINLCLESLEKAKKEPDLTKRTEWMAYLQSEIDKFTVKAKPFGRMQDLIDERERLEQELENSRHRRGAPFGSTVRPLQKDLDQASDELGKAMSDAVTKRSYVQMAITTFEVYTLLTHSMMQCGDSRREALTLAMPPADLQASATVCITHEGPFGCTGQFNGSYQLTCSGDGTSQQDQGGGTVNFRPDGWIDLRFKSTVYPDANPRPLSGEIDGQGRVRIDRIDRDAGITESWFGQFNLVSIENGKLRPTGSGNSEIRVTDGQGNLQFSCQGTFQLTDEGAL